MPQPLLRVAPDANFILADGGAQVIEERPQLAQLAMRCIASWAHVETVQMFLYATMAGGSTADAAAVYFSLEIATAKAAALRTLAERRLKPDYLAVFNALSALAKSAQKRRDKIAHHAWGVSPQVPDALLLADPRSLVFGLNDQGAPDEMALRFQRMREAVYVYKEPDFVDIIAANHRLVGHILGLNLAIYSAEKAQGAEIIAQLSSESEILEILDRQASRDQSSREALPR